ncbi:MAG: hypothetical protein M9958_09995 [Chitinophagales bacterium]|nr:hypothetical protein [Chitinophagales bacterium]
MIDGKKNAKSKNVVKSTPLISKLIISQNESIEKEDIELRTSINEELEELLQKDKKRFFGGCGG